MNPKDRIEDAQDRDTPTRDRRPDPLRRWALGIVAALVVLFALQIASDRTAPVSRLGTVEGLALPIAPRVAGEIVAVEAQDNQRVAPGDPIFSIDPVPYRLAVDNAEAQLALAGQDIGVSTAAVATAQARLGRERANLANARAQADRTLELVTRGVYPAARGDDARETLAEAEAAVIAAESEVEGAKAALGPEGSDNPQFRAASAALERARYDLERTEVKAPTQGFVTNLSVGVGEVVQAGQPLGTLIDTTGGWIVVFFRENQLAAIETGAPVEILLDLVPGRVFPGRVASFSGGISTPNQTARPGGLISLPPGYLSGPQRHGVVIEFDPPNSIPKGVRVGSQATVMVRGEASGALGPLWWLWMRALAVLSYAS